MRELPAQDLPPWLSISRTQLAEEERSRQRQRGFLRADGKREQRARDKPVPSPQVDEQGAEVKRRGERARAAAYVGHGLRLYGMERKDEGRDERGPRSPDAPAGGQAQPDGEHQSDVDEVNEDIEGMEARLAEAGGPVRGVARLQHRPQAAPEVACESRPRMHCRVL